MLFFQLGNLLLSYLIANRSGIEAFGVFQFFVATTMFFSYFAKLGYDEEIAYRLPQLGGSRSLNGQNYINDAISKTLSASLYASFSVIAFYVLISLISTSPTNLVDSFNALLFLPGFVFSLVISAIFRAERRMLNRSILVYLLPPLINIIGILILQTFDSTRISAPIQSRSIAYVVTALGSIFLLRKLPFTPRISLNLRPWETPKSWLWITLLGFVFESGTLAIWFFKIFFSAELLGTTAITLRLAGLCLLGPTAISISAGPMLAKKFISNPEDKKSVKIFCQVNLVLSTSTALILYLGRSILFPIFNIENQNLDQPFGLLLLATVFIAATQPLQISALARNRNSTVIKTNILGIFGYSTPLIALALWGDPHLAIPALAGAIGVFCLIRINLLHGEII